jgi:phospholipid/cholesterol/gamma-HCH transport system permease protein
MPEMIQHRQDEQATLHVVNEQGALHVAATGRWIIEEAQALDRQIAAIGDTPLKTAVKTARFDLAKVSEMDTVGAWLLLSARERLGTAGIEAQFIGLQHQHQVLLNHIARSREKDRDEKNQGTPGPSPTVKDRIAAPVVALGATIASAAAEARDVVGFIGLALARSVSMRRHHHPLRFGAVTFQLEQVWLKALPIVALSTFLIGLAAMYLGAAQLARLGAGDIAVQAIAFAILLEIGVLLPAILVAGRSASAFAAQIGAMKTGDEVNAMLVAGLDPMVTLVIPRVVALIIAVPLLGVIGQISGLVGCFLMAWIHLGLSLAHFMERVEVAAGIEIFLIGILKTPFFGAIIAFVGCFQGMKASGTAIEVGQRTTRAVVQALVLVILFDALYSVGLWVALVES